MIIAVSIIGVALGGFLGGMARAGLSRLIPHHYGTLAANLIACAVLGLAIGLIQQQSLGMVFAYFTFTMGFAGGMSTWSTFAAELGEMLKGKKYWEFAKYLLLTLSLGIVFAWRGNLWAASALAQF